MNDATITAPVKFVRSVSELCFPPKADRRLQQLMDRNSEGKLTAAERRELEALVELSETMGILRGEAMVLMRRRS